MDVFLQEFQHLKIQLEEIKSATCNFDNSKLIGRGGFGMVYKGVLTHSKGQTMAAFKRLDRNHGQGDPEFWKEIVMLCGCTHENLISLVGFCDEDGEKILVYEYASHGSLDRHLSTTTLTWRQRLKICLGAAKGLCYLHDPNGTHQRVIHRDIKSSNILLDENWNAKVSDMGLSKIGPANLTHSFIATNVVGTPGYCDPLYMETYSLTKESDVYSFGVVLFEVLCGRLCFEYNNNHFKSLVQIWKTRYIQNKLDKIIFQDLEQPMDLSALEIFSDIAYRCLQKSRAERPKMSHVVEKLEIALGFQEFCEQVEVEPSIGKTMVPPVVYISKQDLKMLPSKGIFVNGGKTWVLLKKNGLHCEMISAAECLIPIQTVPSKYAENHGIKSRFPVEYCSPLCLKFKTHVRPQFLSPYTTYTVNLVFQLQNTVKNYLGFTYILAGEVKHSTSNIAHEREDGWLMAELYQFTSNMRSFDLEITFECKNQLTVEGIEFQPIQREGHEALEDEEMDMQTISHSDTKYWEQKLPTDYKDIIKWSKDSLQWTTKKELYSILRKGFLINNNKAWFSLAKNGKKCHMIPASVALQKQEWSWRSSPESRFPEVAFDPHDTFWILCGSRILSPQTTYGIFLVYKLQGNQSGFEAPLKVTISDGVFLESSNDMDYSVYIYLLTPPSTPIIRQEVYQTTHNPLNIPKKKGLPQKRNDGWMEVQVWEFQTGATTQWISKSHQLTFVNNESHIGLLVLGIELKPI